MSSSDGLPLITADLPGTGGVLRRSPEDFVVVEIPAYLPEGQGDHVFLRIRKRGITTIEAVRRLGRAVGASDRDIGYAGLKDRHAVTEQWISLPPPITVEAARAIEGGDDLEILEVTRHRNKLRTGHLRGNRFRLVIREPAVDVDEAVRRAEAILAALRAPPGSPNWFGEQRFGHQGDNASLGRALILGERLARNPKGRHRRLLISAYQASLFNRALASRIEDGLYRTVIAGDLLQKVGSGGLFASDDPGVDQQRLDAGELAITGPMFGHKMRSPTPASPAAEREDRILAAEGLSLASFARAGKLATGTRRAYSVILGEPAVERAGEASIAISFGLPAGSYATALMREIVKPSSDP